MWSAVISMILFYTSGIIVCEKSINWDFDGTEPAWIRVLPSEIEKYFSLLVIVCFEKFNIVRVWFSLGLWYYGS